MNNSAENEGPPKTFSLDELESLIQILLFIIPDHHNICQLIGSILLVYTCIQTFIRIYYPSGKKTWKKLFNYSEKACPALVE